MSWNISPEWVIAGTTIFYTIGTFLLWWVTYRSMGAIRDAFKLNFLMAAHEIKRSTPGANSPDRFEMMNALFLRTEALEALKRAFPDDYKSLLPSELFSSKEKTEQEKQENSGKVVS